MVSLDKIGVLLFNQVEILDFAGPVQVFAAYHTLYPNAQRKLTTIGLDTPISVSKVGLSIAPDLTIDQDSASYDLVIIPGGMGTRPIIKDEAHLKRINQLLLRSNKVASVCTGSLILAKLGRLSGLRATTHFLALDLLSELDPTIIVDRSKRYHDHGDIILSEGVSAGIDMSLYLIAKLDSQEKADAVRKYIEYYPEAY
jgi:transcriptional regulator GlxA family with amidase domain